MAGHLWKVYPNEGGSLDQFAFVGWYVDERVSMEYTEETEYLVSWRCKVSLMDLQLEICLKVHSLKRERDQEMLSLKECSSL